MMRSATALAIAVMSAAPAVMGAQQSQLKSEPAHKTVLLTGCLERVRPESPFTLTNATSVSRTTPEQVSPSPVGTAGTPRTPEMEYELRPVTGVSESGVDEKELARHIGRRVEITARPIEEAPAPAPTPATSATESPKARDQAAAKTRLTVTAITSLGMPCP
jgi:hypothetical protein